MKPLLLVSVLLTFIHIPFSSGLELRRLDEHLDTKQREALLLRRPRETSKGTFVLNRHGPAAKDVQNEEKDVLAGEGDQDNKTAEDLLQPMISTPQGICMYSLPDRFNLGLLNSTFKQPVPPPRNISPANTPPLQGMFDTIQFSLERIFYDRFLSAAYETRPAKDCVLFYVPYFVAWETSSVHGTWINAHRPELDADLFTHLTHYNISGVPGQNHFFVIGRISLNVHHFLMDQKFKNAMKLVLEDTAPAINQNIFAIPYPTWFRYYPGLEPTNNARLGKMSTIKVHSTALKIERSVKDCNPNWFGDATIRLQSACDGKDFCSFHILPQLDQWVIGKVYEAMDANGQWWPVTIKSKNPDGTFGVDVHDGPGTHWPRVYKTHMRKHGQVASAAAHNTTVKCEALDVAGKYSCGGTTSYTFKSLPGQVSIGHAVVLGCPRGPCWLWGTCNRQTGFGATAGTANPKRTGPLLAIIGSARDTEYERAIIFEMCDQRPQDCATFRTGHRENSTTFVHDHIADMYQLLMASTFCVNPPGDTPTRKGLFDSLVLGCIPVITSEDSLQHYRFHLPFWRSISLLVTTDNLFSIGFNLVDFLDSYVRDHPQDIAQKQEAIRRYAYSLQYSFSPSTNVQRGLDAFDTTLAHLLSRASSATSVETEDFPGVYSITGVASGRHLFANKDGDYNTQFGASPGVNISNEQKWRLVGKGDGSCCYSLINVDSGRAFYAQVNATDWSKLGASVAHNSVWADQKWRLNREGPNTYNIVNVASGRRLFALPGHAGSIGIGATLRTAGSRDERWQQAWKWQVKKIE